MVHLFIKVTYVKLKVPESPPPSLCSDTVRTLFQRLQLEPRVPGWASGVFHTSGSQSLGSALPVQSQAFLPSTFLFFSFFLPMW